MAQKRTTVSLQGVVTQANTLDLPAGTLSEGVNVAMYKQGVYEARQQFDIVSNMAAAPAATPGGQATRKMWQTPNQLLTVSSDVESGTSAASSMRWAHAVTGVKTAVANPANRTLAFDPGKTQLTNTRDRYIVTERTSPIVLDSEGDAAARISGVPMPPFLQIFPTVATGGWFLANKFVSYRALFKRNFPNGYFFRGAVSFQGVVLNGGADGFADVDIAWPASVINLAAGDEIEVYRTELADTADEVGDRHRLAFTHVLTAGQVAAGSVNNIIDITNEDALGADCYFNSAQEGAAKNNYPPPPSTDTVTFKGATFYNSTQAWHTLQETVPYQLGNLLTATAQASGIGRRAFTAVTVSGNPAVTVATLTPGVVVGQRVIVGGGPVPVNANIISITGVGPFTVTFDQNATVSFPGGTAIGVGDVLVFDIPSLGIANRIVDAYSVVALTQSGFGNFPVTFQPDRAVQLNGTVDEGVSLNIQIPYSGLGPFRVRATNGQNWSPPIPSLTSGTYSESSADPRTNRVYFSKVEQPECVPPDQYLFVGNGTILRLWKTRDLVFVFCTDGVYTIDGDGDDWNVRPYNLEINLTSSDAIDAMDNEIYLITDKGLLTFSSEGGAVNISQPLIDGLVKTTFARWKTFFANSSFVWPVQVACDRQRNEVWYVFAHYNGASTDFDCYIWNTLTKTWFTFDGLPSFAIVYHAGQRSPFLSIAGGLGSPLLYKYSASQIYFPARVTFNPFMWDDVGLLKEWLDTTVFTTGASPMSIEFLSETGGSLGGYSFTSTSETVLPQTLNACIGRQLTLRLQKTNADTAAWIMQGLSIRYRMASETLR